MARYGRAIVLVGGVAAWGSALGWGGCGGTAVVDGRGAVGGDGSGGDTTSSTTSSTTTSQSTASGVVCVTPDPIGPQVDCSVAVSAGSGQPIACDTAVCDSVNQWTSACSGEGCTCLLNGIVRCSCVLEGGGTMCLGNTESCCPAPFPP